jgi:SAM-dependent methyltransferase
MLYDLVVLKKSLLEAYDTSRIQEEIITLRTQIENVKAKVDSMDQQHLDYINNLVEFHNQLIVQVNTPSEDFRNKIREIDDKITEVSHRLFANNYELEERDGGVDNIQNRRINLRPEVEDIVKQRINMHSSWQYPALEIGCYNGEWTKLLIASDPLYIMDKYPRFLEETNNSFPEQYQRRLRKYPLKDYNFDALPKGQFGFIFSWSHFNYVSLDTMTQVLKSVKTLLRPGGVFMFSYNDGDTPEGAGMAENFAQTYLPQGILVPTCLSLGFEILRSFNELPNTSWLEIKQPGTLKTIKAHQVFGKPERRTT